MSALLFIGHLFIKAKVSKLLMSECRCNGLSAVTSAVYVCVLPGPYLLQSRHHPWLKMGVDNLFQGMIQESGIELYIVSPGISGHRNSVSFELKVGNI